MKTNQIKLSQERRLKFQLNGNFLSLVGQSWKMQCKDLWGILRSKSFHVSEMIGYIEASHLLLNYTHYPTSSTQNHSNFNFSHLWTEYSFFFFFSQIKVCVAFAFAFAFVQRKPGRHLINNFFMLQFQLGIICVGHSPPAFTT